MKAQWEDFGPLPGYERCVRFKIGNKVGVIIVHNTALGPALGGFRVKPYRSEAEMVADAARLARGMSYKNASSGLELGGGKAAVRIKNGQTITPAFLRAYGQVVEALGGKYITAPDFGTDVAMMDIISITTQFVDCLSIEKGGLGDPSPSTARGVFLALQTAIPFVPIFRRTAHLRVLIQGYGKVGQSLARMLKDEEYHVLVAENDATRRHQAATDGFELVKAKNVFATPAHVFVPCATGNILYPETIIALKEVGIRLICGGANNQLRDENRDSALLKTNCIWWVPDYIANAGGVAIACTEWEVRAGKIERAKAAERTEERLQNLAKRCRRIMVRAEASDHTTLEAARKLAEDTVAKQGGELR